MDGTRGLRAWRWLFLIEGVITVAIAMVAFFVLPNFPRTTKWLSEEEIALATWRLEEDIGQDDWVTREDQTLWHGFKEALQDVKMWVLVSAISLSSVEHDVLMMNSLSFYLETYPPLQ